MQKSYGFPQFSIREEEQRKWAEAMAQPVEKAQCQEPVETIPVNPEKLYLRQREEYFRAIAFEAALAVYKRDGFLPIKSMAQSFYTYITKGE
jgi:hypothetical protein